MFNKKQFLELTLHHIASQQQWSLPLEKATDDWSIQLNLIYWLHCLYKLCNFSMALHLLLDLPTTKRMTENYQILNLQTACNPHQCLGIKSWQLFYVSRRAKNLLFKWWYWILYENCLIKLFGCAASLSGCVRFIDLYR